MSRRTRKNIGLIGLGIIGDRVRDVLRRKGFQVFVWNRTPRTVPNFVGAPAELAEMCDFIQVFVSDDDALLYVVKQLSPALSARHIVIAHPTVSPNTMVSASEVVARRGARFIEAPFTGSKEAAENGELVYYIGADAAVLEEARALLAASSKEILEIGEVGQATAIKVATNMVTAASVQASAEALALVQATGIPPEKFAAAMKQNASYSKTLSMKLPKMIERNFERHFSVQHMLKDMQIASRLGLTHHLELGVTAASRDRLLEQAQRGHGEEDYSALARKYSQDSKPATEADLELFQRQRAEQPVKPVPQPVAAKPIEANLETPSPAPTPAAATPKPEAAIATQPAAMPNERKLEIEPEPAPATESIPASAEALAAAAAPGSALAALQAHMPAAPFLNPVASAQSVSENAESTAPVAVESTSDFLPPEPVSSETAENEERGFFSRLLRRANS
jgi:3-hydroxyisobutyrate dehydrogenase-like beta-hydroxyacid dehydrogenase